ncbi:MAG: glycosyltransferase [Acidobacteriia bacterium]|nr:glycosyltransferase [Terriglobia bacterium]
MSSHRSNDLACPPARSRSPEDRPLERECGRRPVVGLVSYDSSVPSFRLRMAALRPPLERSGIDVCIIDLGRGREWRRVIERAEELRSCDLLIFQQVKLLGGERALVGRCCGIWVLDVDDAIMFRRPRQPGEAPSQARWRQRRFRRMAERCRLVVAGSGSLAGLIGTAAPRLEVLFTPVDLSAYPVAELPPRDRVRLAWIGLGSNLCYLEGLAPALRRLRSEGVDFELHVISDRLPDMEGVPCVRVPWSESREGAALADCDVGLAPITDDVWTRGKAGYRCIQYAAAGLPTVASPVGANREVVIDGETGLWASTDEEWSSALRRLCGDAGLRKRMGTAARTACRRFELSEYGRRYVELVTELLSRREPPAL